MTSSHGPDPDGQRIAFPIQSLQPEILSKIFTFCLPEPFVYPKVAMRVTLTICNVCSFWRALAITTRPLWTRFQVVLDWRSLKRIGTVHLIEHIHTWLGRSGTHPVTIHFYCYGMCIRKPDIVQACEAIAMYAFRWEALEIITDVALNSWANLVDAPLLRILSLHSLLKDIPFTSAPRLTNLTLLFGLSCSPSDITNIPWHQLTDISLSRKTEGNRILDVMRYSPCLESLHAVVGNPGPRLISPYNLPIEHVTLQSLSLRLNRYSCSVFSSLILPALSMLSLATEDIWCDDTELLELLNRSHCELTHLALAGYMFTSLQLSKFLKMENCRTLTNLTIIICDNFRTPSVNDEVIRQLTFVNGEDGNEITPPCPNLAQLALHGFSKRSSAGVLGKMILSRCSKGRHLSLFNLTTTYRIAEEDNALLKLAHENGLRFEYKVIGERWRGFAMPSPPLHS